MKRIANILVACVVACAAWAVPARKGAVEMTQPEGSIVNVYLHGDESFHWQTNELGEWIELNEEGYFHVVEALNEGQIRANSMSNRRGIQRPARAAVDLNLAPRGLVILVNFADLAFETSKVEMDSMIAGKNYTRDYYYLNKKKDTIQVTSSGSAWQYFYDSSYGQYDPQFDVVGPVTVSKKMSHYGQNGTWSNDANVDQMIKEACELIEDSVDFKEYDNDGDGEVDFVYVIYAGYGEADGGGANTIWPHTWQLDAAGTRCFVDSMVVNLYACGNELEYESKAHTGIGTFCHEFSHVLGLPDLYVTDYGNHKTWGEWSVMDYGPYANNGNTPPAYSAYERFFMGWLTPELIVDSAEMVLEELNSSKMAFLISETDEHNLIGNDPNPTTFYLLENRQQTGWDEYLPGHGMMLTKVQYSYSKWTQNTVNNTSSKQGVDIIEALTNKGKSEKATDLFPAGATEYTKITDHAIRNIEEKDGVIYFRYRMSELIEEEEEEGGEDNGENEGGNGDGTEDDGKEDEDEEEEGDGVEDVLVEQNVVAIYNLLGQKQMTNDIENLARGTYIVKTSSGTYKIMR